MLVFGSSFSFAHRGLRRIGKGGRRNRLSVRCISSSFIEHNNDVSHLERTGSKVDAYWLEHLRAVRRPAARALIPQLVDSNPLGYEPPTGPAKKGTLLEYCVAQKAMHPSKVTLTRVGEFYETHGVDSIMLVEHCGLNPMGNKAKAGCPVRNVQATLDGLTRMGFTVAIYEELVDVNANPGPRARTRIKQRALAQVLT